MTKEKQIFQALVLRASKGEERALSQLYRLTFPNLYRFGAKAFPNADEANIQDAIQNVFLWMAQHHQKLGKIQNIEAYLYQSVRQNLTRKMAQESKERKAQQSYLEKSQLYAIQYQSSIEERILEEESTQLKQDIINNAISMLPEYQRTALHLRYFEERSYEEIAEILGSNQQVARNFVSRAVKSMRKHLKNKALRLSFLLTFFLLPLFT